MLTFPPPPPPLLLLLLVVGGSAARWRLCWRCSSVAGEAGWPWFGWIPRDGRFNLIAIPLFLSRTPSGRLLMIRHWLPQENDTSSGSNLGHRRLISSLNQPRQVTQTYTHTHTHTFTHSHTWKAAFNYNAVACVASIWPPDGAGVGDWGVGRRIFSFLWFCRLLLLLLSFWVSIAALSNLFIDSAPFDLIFDCCRCEIICVRAAGLRAVEIETIKQIDSIVVAAAVFSFSLSFNHRSRVHWLFRGVEVGGGGWRWNMLQTEYKLAWNWSLHLNRIG